MAKAPNKIREQSIRYAQSHGLHIKGERLKRVGGYCVTVFHPRTKWVNCFDSWEETFAFFQAVNLAAISGKALPWA